LVIDLCIDSGVANQIDNPFLAFVLRQAQTSGEIPVELLVWHFLGAADCS
jgi:hypothetical protein